jgi:hyperosmotically inducible protein
MFARFASALLVLLVACAPAGAAQGDNLQLFRDVQRQVLLYPHFTIFDSVRADVDQGKVLLTGNVTMPYKRTDIERRVRALADVQEVDNRIEVLRTSQFDDDLRIRLARALYGSQHFQAYASMVNPPIHIIVDRGRVTLEGVVQTDMDRLIARSIANSAGAFGVTIRLQTEAEVRHALERL